LETTRKFVSKVFGKTWLEESFLRNGGYNTIVSCCTIQDLVSHDGGVNTVSPRCAHGVGGVLKEEEEKTTRGKPEV